MIKKICGKEENEIRITKTQKVECCAECFLYEPDHDMNATILACRELYDRELNSYLKFKKKCSENNSIALNCPFISERQNLNSTLQKYRI